MTKTAKQIMDIQDDLIDKLPADDAEIAAIEKQIRAKIRAAKLDGRITAATLDELTAHNYHTARRAIEAMQRVYSMQDWKTDRDFKAEPGQEITEDVYNEMLNCMPPQAIPQGKARQALREYNVPVHAGFLMGEPHSTDTDGTPLYRAFGMNDYGKGKHYYYLGLSKEARRLDGTYYYMDCMNAFVNDGLFPVSEFESDAEAIQKAADYEATLYRDEYRDGVRISSTILYQPRFF